MSAETFALRFSQARLFELAEDLLPYSGATVALQFSRHLLKHSTEVLRRIENELQQQGCSDLPRFYIVTDVLTNNTCCVDLLSVLHYVPKCVVYVGFPCFTPIELDIPVFFLFPETIIDLPTLDKQLQDFLTIFFHENKCRNFLLFYDLQYAYAYYDFVELLKRCRPVFKKNGVDNILIAETPKKLTESSVAQDKPEWCFFNRTFINVESGKQQLKPLETDDLLGSALICYIGETDIERNTFFRAFALRLGSLDTSFAYNPSITTPSFHDLKWKKTLASYLRLRYSKIMKGWSAARFGIINYSMNLQSKQVVQHLADLCRKQKCERLIFALRKLTEECLANHQLYSNFCVCGCLESSLVPNPKAFHSNLITPFELEVILHCREWSTNYILDPHELLQLKTNEKLEMFSHENKNEDKRATLVKQTETTLACADISCPVLSSINVFRGVPLNQEERLDAVIYEGHSGTASAYAFESKDKQKVQRS